MSPIRELLRANSEWVPLHGGLEGEGTPNPEPEAFILGTTKPSAENTGLNVLGIAPASLTVVSGGRTHTTNDTVYEDMRFTGVVDIRAKRVTYRNCWFNGPGTAGTALVMCINSVCEEIVFENCLFKASSIGDTVEGTPDNCLFGHDFTLYRCDLSNSIDLLGLYSGVSLSVPARNVSILGSYLHDMTYYSPDPDHSNNQTHNDGIQVHGGAHNFLMRGTRVEAYYDPLVGDASEPPVIVNDQLISGNKIYPSLAASCFLVVTPINTTAGINSFVIDKNWLGGGVVVINWPRSDGVNVAITNNRWTRGTYYGDDFTILMKQAQVATVTGNYYEDTGVPWNERKKG